MLATEYQSVTAPFIEFSQHAKRFIHIQSATDYQQTLDLIEALFNEAEDTATEPLHDLISLLSQAIENYENKQPDLNAFEHLSEQIDPAISALRVLMSQHHLTSTDLKAEIGSKSLVSMILAGKRALTKQHIDKLSQRFNVSPAIFFTPTQPTTTQH